MAALEERWYTLSKRMRLVHQQSSRQLDKACFVPLCTSTPKPGVPAPAHSLLVPSSAITEGVSLRYTQRYALQVLYKK
jgi:hypothetical protein